MAFSSAEFGMAVFILFLLIAFALYLIDQYKRINLSLPYGRTIPYTLAVIGAGIFLLAAEGLVGFFMGLAVAIFTTFAMQEGLKRLKTQN